jgi:hypothetical protein
MRALVIPALMLLAACDTQALTDKALRRAAESVVTPVVNRDMPAEVAQTATRCILDAASKPEIEGLARDVGVEAGTLTIANIRAIASRPAAAACFAAGGVPPLRG